MTQPATRNFRLAALFAIAALFQPAAWSQAAQQQGSTQNQVPVPKGVPSMMPAEPGTTIDRVIAIVDGQIVLDSDVDEERRFEAIQPFVRGTGLPDATTRDQEIERLVNRTLILQQAKLQVQDTTTDADVEKEISSLRQTIPACRTMNAPRMPDGTASSRATVSARPSFAIGGSSGCRCWHSSRSASVRVRRSATPR